MKFNLKNRPIIRYFRSTSYGKLTKKQFEEWFEGFEKELREILNDKYTQFVQRQTIKEILGEAD